MIYDDKKYKDCNNKIEEFFENYDENDESTPYVEQVKNIQRQLRLIKPCLEYAMQVRYNNTPDEFKEIIPGVESYGYNDDILCNIFYFTDRWMNVIRLKWLIDLCDINIEEKD